MCLDVRFSLRSTFLKSSYLLFPSIIKTCTGTNIPLSPIETIVPNTTPEHPRFREDAKNTEIGIFITAPNKPVKSWMLILPIPFTIELKMLFHIKRIVLAATNRVSEFDGTTELPIQNKINLELKTENNNIAIVEIKKSFKSALIVFFIHIRLLFVKASVKADQIGVKTMLAAMENTENSFCVR